MKYSVLLLKDVHDSGKNLLRQNDCEVIIAKGSRLEDYIDDLKKCDAIFVRNEPVTAMMIDAAPNLKVIAKHGVGYDNIDVSYATKKKIQVVYVPTGNINSVADMAMLHILNCARRFRFTQQEFLAGNYDIRFKINDTHQLLGKTLALIGCGNIARLVAKRAKYGFDMKVIGYDPYVKPGLLDCGIEVRESREEVFKEADFVSIHLPSLSKTIHSSGMAEFKLMKNSAYLINTARGNIIREEELVEAIRQGVIAGAGLDVFEEEPVLPNHPLLLLDSVSVTPHCSGLTAEASESISKMGAQGILEAFHHQPITWPVNKVLIDG